MRDKHIEFILKDTKERGETITSDISFMGCLYMLKVKKEGSKRSKTVNYSAAKSIMSGCREIKMSA